MFEAVGEFFQQALPGFGQALEFVVEDVRQEDEVLRLQGLLHFNEFIGELVNVVGKQERLFGVFGVTGAIDLEGIEIDFL